jgi:hypothetical protein
MIAYRFKVWWRAFCRFLLRLRDFDLWEWLHEQAYESEEWEQEAMQQRYDRWV